MPEKLVNNFSLFVLISSRVNETLVIVGQCVRHIVRQTTLHTGRFCVKMDRLSDRKFIVLHDIHHNIIQQMDLKENALKLTLKIRTYEQ